MVSNKTRRVLPGWTPPKGKFRGDGYDQLRLSNAQMKQYDRENRREWNAARTTRTMIGQVFYRAGGA